MSSWLADSPVELRLAEHGGVSEQHLNLPLSHVGNKDRARIGGFCAAQGCHVLHDLVGRREEGMGGPADYSLLLVDPSGPQTFILLVTRNGNESVKSGIEE